MILTLKNYFNNLNNIHCKTLNLPKIVLPNDFYNEDKKGWHSTKAPGYYTYGLFDNIKNKIVSIFPKDFFTDDTNIIAQVIKPGVNNFIHTDGTRLFAMNYLIARGGQNVSLGLYDDNKNLIKDHIQLPGEWIMLNTQKNHALNNIETVRTSISIQFFKINQKQSVWINERIRD